jgi:predicted HAD superfamily Cof-like phosphohydrolase
MSIIIIEGCDFAGKSTLINKLSKDLSLLAIKAIRPRTMDDVDNWLDKVTYLTADEPIICDRTPLISEPIYGDIIRGNPVIDAFSAERDLSMLYPIVVFCNPPWDHVKTCDNEQMSGVHENLMALHGRYQEHVHALSTMCVIDMIEYDFTKDSYENLLTELNNKIIHHSEKEDIEFTQIDQFHRHFEVWPETGMPNILTPEVMEFRERFLKEEVQEFIDAYDAKDLVTMFDSLIDLVYVAKGSAYLMGITSTQWRLGFERVHNANMQKIRAQSAADSKRGTQLDVIKPPHWVAPEADLKKILGI